MSEQTVQRSRELFESGWFCAESVLKAIAEHHGIASDLIPALATGFCGGMARTCGECGAVTGGIMALGLVNGRRLPEQHVDTLYPKVQSLIAQFTERYGSINCQQLTGVDLGTDAGQAAFKAQGKFSDCLNYVGDATQMVLALLAED